MRPNGNRLPRTATVWARFRRSCGRAICRCLPLIAATGSIKAPSMSRVSGRPALRARSAGMSRWSRRWSSSRSGRAGEQQTRSRRRRGVPGSQNQLVNQEHALVHKVVAQSATGRARHSRAPRGPCGFVLEAGDGLCRVALEELDLRSSSCAVRPRRAIYSGIAILDDLRSSVSFGRVLALAGIRISGSAALILRRVPRLIGSGELPQLSSGRRVLAAWGPGIGQ
jgi:hypothetical protein